MPYIDMTFSMTKRINLIKQWSGQILLHALLSLLLYYTCFTSYYQIFFYKIMCKLTFDILSMQLCDFYLQTASVFTAGESTLWCGQIRAYVYKMATNQIRCMHKNISAALIFDQFPVSNLACVLNLSKTNFLPISQ